MSCRAAVREGNDRVAGGGVVPAAALCGLWSPRREESDSFERHEHVEQRDAWRGH